LANNLKSLTASERFFYDHAGYSYDPKTETRQQGRIRCARSLADAELSAIRLGWSYVWSDDWDVGSHKEFYGKGSAYEDSEPNTCEHCTLKDSDGRVLASLGCIDDADSNYRRVIEAELADETLYTLRRADPFWDVPEPLVPEPLEPCAECGGDCHSLEQGMRESLARPKVPSSVSPSNPSIRH